MAIYADKKAGHLTGWFRVEVQAKGRRLRDRCRTMDEARSREQHFKECLALDRQPKSEKAVRTLVKTLASPLHRLHRPAGRATISTIRKAGDGRIWRGQASEAQSLAKLRIIQTVMGDAELDAINDRWVEELKAELVGQRGMTDHTVNRYLACLSKALKWAVRMEYRALGKLPAIELYNEESGRVRVLSRAEEAKAYELLDTRLTRVVRVAVRTGMRRGELLGVALPQLRTGWVDLWTTKSGSPRSIPLTPEDEADLRWLADGRMPTVQQLRVGWQKLKLAIAPTDNDFVFHCTRHTFATRAVESGVHPRVLQQLMGHKSFKMTERYTHMSDALLRNSLIQMFPHAKGA